MKALVKIPMDQKHKIVIPTNVWEYLKLRPGDYITIDITKEPAEPEQFELGETIQ